MMAARQIDYMSIFGSYVMKTQYERCCKTEAEGKKRESGSVIQETIEDYIEQA